MAKLGFWDPYADPKPRNVANLAMATTHVGGIPHMGKPHMGKVASQIGYLARLGSEVATNGDPRDESQLALAMAIANL